MLLTTPDGAQAEDYTIYAILSLTGNGAFPAAVQKQVLTLLAANRASVRR